MSHQDWQLDTALGVGRGPECGDELLKCQAQRLCTGKAEDGQLPVRSVSQSGDAGGIGVRVTAVRVEYSTAQHSTVKYMHM
jgi:hypothetical protein